ncbi:RNA-directed DNA polymerase from mobile element jockey-like [Brachionus plicatilis]|uniref:RNA-directed DNA polymerase from mobile element jockey-like n=1 Tax=Brachionus plicatilis TaxID=10195 RepID=A0A3M7R5N5_BRAPC|nr:RNA-directed DNA polymerase from mobile element jockey-like [Brachionus plicatilis]
MNMLYSCFNARMIHALMSDSQILIVYETNKIESQKQIKLTFTLMVDEIKQRFSSRLNLIKILSNKKWGLNYYTLGNLYKSLLGSIIDYSFPCLNSFSETNIKKIQVLLNSAVRFRQNIIWSLTDSKITV